jgi:hypothetical protein
MDALNLSGQALELLTKREDFRLAGSATCRDQAASS